MEKWPSCGSEGILEHFLWSSLFCGLRSSPGKFLSKYHAHKIWAYGSVLFLGWCNILGLKHYNVGSLPTWTPTGDPACLMSRCFAPGHFFVECWLRCELSYLPKWLYRGIPHEVGKVQSEAFSVMTHLYFVSTWSPTLSCALLCSHGKISHRTSAYCRELDAYAEVCSFQRNK